MTAFNNDHDNSSEKGGGSDKEYIETCEGRPLAINAVKGRYVRFYSRGSTENEMNHYTEIEVYGREQVLPGGRLVGAGTAADRFGFAEFQLLGVRI